MCCSVGVSICLVCCMFDSVCKLFGDAMCLGAVADLLLNVMVVFSVGGGTLLDIPCMVFHRMCVLYM